MNITRARRRTYARVERGSCVSQVSADGVGDTPSSVRTATQATRYVDSLQQFVRRVDRVLRSRDGQHVAG